MSDAARLVVAPFAFRDAPHVAARSRATGAVVVAVRYAATAPPLRLLAGRWDAARREIVGARVVPGCGFVDKPGLLAAASAALAAADPPTTAN